ncbi:hypothetical protein N6L26_02125 [Qipengyuania sp. SS22]|uniref:hypothetical protein n=1 Tax=Qipengyuania sp. SS22 TaxID=2979461 RepID=UPI0021E5A60D|nr:hypothetical protein [Qipengyuania sp. SS22]UYH55386.1 hypothetical protein N6L26_02125 [Qipengyuania sp. SS22]
MHIDPQIGALRGDAAAQRAMSEAVAQVVAECRKDAGLAPVLQDLEAYGSGTRLVDCPALTDLFANGGAALSVTAPVVGKLVEVHRAYPLAQLAFRHQSRPGFHFLQLAAKGRAALGLALHDDQAAQDANAAATFPDSEWDEIVLAGAADIALLEIRGEQRDHAVIDSRYRTIEAGDRLSFAGAAKSRMVRRVHGRFLTLRLTRVAPRPQPTRQFDLASGRLVHRASGDRHESRDEMMMALLGRMRRTDAAPVFAAMSRSGSDHLRWQALRECLALDSAAGFAALDRIATDATDDLAPEAGALRARLVEAHPQLAQWEPAPCPA